MKLLTPLFVALTMLAAFPSQAEDGLAAFSYMEGRWVTKTAYHSDGQWGEPTAPGRATADTMLGGSFIRLDTPIIFAGAPFQFEITVAYDRFNKVYRLAVLDDLNGYMDFFNGTAADGVLSATNADSGTAFPTAEGPRATAKLEIVKTETGFEIVGYLGQEGSDTYAPYMRIMFEPLQ